MSNLQALRQFDDTSAKQLMAGNEAGVRSYFASRRHEIKALVPSHMDDLRVLRCAVNAINATPTLLQCTMDSLFGAISYCATLGLEPNTPAHHCYLVPFYNSRNRNYDVQVIPGYRGLIELATRDPRIKMVDARTVYDGDVFEYEEGAEPVLIHKPVRPSARSGGLIGHYARVWFTDGGRPAVLFLYDEDIIDHRERFGNCYYVDKQTKERKPKKDSPWFAHPLPMARKTVIRQILGTMPQSPEFVKLDHLQQLNEQMLNQGMGRVLEGEVVGAEAEPLDPNADPDDDSDAPTPKPAPKPAAAKAPEKKESGMPALFDLISSGQIAEIINSDTGEALDGEHALREIFARIKALIEKKDYKQAMDLIEQARKYSDRIPDPDKAKQGKTATTKYETKIKAAQEKPAHKTKEQPALEQLIKDGTLLEILGDDGSLLDGREAVEKAIADFKLDPSDKSALANARLYVEHRVTDDKDLAELLKKLKMLEA